ncbi:MFS transporter [Actinomadura xylanilytica]|uniref:MFS transporter n=1 Tax=Actinomadura xylanilytica TaxID=887459 RepID=UPI00255AF916|nr:MFS transporter [Actinomadura xylanilytica]MDL4770797.1 MFS transporter [Actinomadura xylanilytica]
MEGRRWAVLAVLSASLLIIAMDATILNVAFPSLVADLRPSAIEQLWIVDAYALALSGLLITAGALGDRWGRRRLLIVGFAVFAAASLLATVATAPWLVIAARALLGVGGAAIMPSTLSILRVVFTDPRERALAFGVWTAVIGAGMALGPMVGGLLVQWRGWHAAFLVNVPFAAVSIVFGLWLLPESRHPREGSWDWWGVALSLAGMVSFVAGVKLVFGHDLATGLLLLGAGALLLALFTRRQLRIPYPLLQVRLFADRAFSVAAATVSLGLMGLVAVLFLFSQWFQYVHGHRPFSAGVMLLPAPIALLAAPLFTTRLLDRFAVRKVLGSAMFVAAAGLALPGAALVAGGLTYPWIAACLALNGAGLGVAATIASSTLMSTSPASESGGAAAVDETAYELGGAFGVAALGSLAVALYRDRLPPLPVSAADSGLIRGSIGEAATVADRLGGTAGGRVLAAAGDAFTSATGLTSVAGAVLTAIAGLIAWRLLPEGFRLLDDPH